MTSAAPEPAAESGSGSFSFRVFAAFVPGAFTVRAAMS